MKKNGSKILVIDDDATVRTTLRESLELEGYEILEAADGQEGLDMVAAGKPPLVFLDLMMPGMSGIEVLDEMKRRKDLATTKVIVYSASGNRDWQIEVLEKGAWYYLDKDDPIEILLAITRNALEARTAQQAMLDGLRMV